MSTPTETLPADTLVYVSSPWAWDRRGTIASLITALRDSMLFSEYSVSQLRTWTGAEPLKISVGGEYDITVTLV